MCSAGCTAYAPQWPLLCFSLWTQGSEPIIWTKPKYEREVTWLHLEVGMCGVTAGLWGFTTVGMFPFGDPRCRVRTPGNHGQGPKSMDFKTEEWNFCVSLATNIYRHICIYISFPDPLPSPGHPWKGIGPFSVGNNFTLQSTKGRTAVSGICVWILRILCKPLVCAFGFSFL